MRVLFATYSLAFQNPGGGERVLLALKNALERSGVEVDFFDPWRPEQDREWARYDLVHYFSSIETSLWEYFKSRSALLPLVVTPTAFFPGGAQRFFSPLKRKVLEGLGDIGFAGLDRWKHLTLPDFWLPTTSSEGADLVSQWGVARDRMHVLRNGVDDRFFEGNPVLFRETSGIQGPFILNVGRFHPVKGQKILIRAARLASAQCVLIGEADLEQKGYFEECRELARAAELSDSSGKTRYHFLGSISHEDPLLASAFAAASAFVLPSQFETFGIAALEAAAAGAPLILTKNMKSADLFGPIARMVDPQNLAEIAAQIQSCLDEAEHVQGESLSGSRAMLEPFKWDHISQELVGVYKSLAKSGA